MVPERECHDLHPRPSGWRHKTALAVFLAIGLFFLVTEHRTHFFGALPYLLLLACPLMHLFMHGGHGRHSAPPECKEDRP
jgi:hypothetical protein